MKSIITPMQVFELAFADTHIAHDAISVADIVAAEHQYLIPIIGAQMHSALLSGNYGELKAEYIAAPLALSTRVMLQPSLDIKSDEGGATQPKGSTHQAASATARQEALRALKRRSSTLLRRLSDHLAENQALYPEYSLGEDVTKRCTIAGGYVHRH